VTSVKGSKRETQRRDVEERSILAINVNVFSRSQLEEMAAKTFNE